MKDIFIDRNFGFLVWIVAVWALYRLDHPAVARVLWWLLVVTTFVDWSVTVWRRRAQRARKAGSRP